MDYTKLTNEELLNEYNEIVEEWDNSNTVFSLTDFEEIIRELVKREINMKKIKVQITKTYVIDVLAENEAEAIEKAQPILDQQMINGIHHYYEVGDTDIVTFDVTDTDDPFYLLYL